MTPNPPPATQVESADVLIDRLLPLPFHSVPSRQQARNAIRARDASIRADERRKVLAMTEPWCVPEIIRILAASADHFLEDHDCDHLGYEKVVAACEAAAGWLTELEAAPSRKDPHE